MPFKIWNLACYASTLGTTLMSLNFRPIFRLENALPKIGLVLIVCRSSLLPSSDSDENNTTETHCKIMCVLTGIV